MKLAMMMALAALCAASPAWAAKEKAADKDKAPAAEKAEAKPKDKAEAKSKDKAGARDKAAEPEEGAAALEGEALAKARKKAMSGKKAFYPKLAPAQKVAEAGQWPLLVAVLPKSSSPALQELEKKVLMRKEFQEFVKPNLVVAILKVEPGKDPKKIDVKRLKGPELKFLENYAVSERMISQAKQNNKDEPTFSDLTCYPMIVCVSYDMSKELFRMARYDREAGFGVWLSQVTDFLREAQIEPVISPKTQKIIDNPDEPKKWK